MSDNDELTNMLEEASKRSIRLRAKLGGTQPTTTTSQPALTSSLSVFGGSSAASSRQANADFASILRQRRKRKELEKDVAELRQVVQKSAPRGNFDRPGASVEKSNDAVQQASCHFFVNPSNWPSAPGVVRSSSVEDMSRPYAEIVRLAEKNKTTLGSWFVLTVRMFNDFDLELQSVMLNLLFWRVVYDEIPYGKGLDGRQFELEALLDCMKCCAVQRNENVVLPSVTQVLQSYGGSISSVSHSKECKADSLDGCLMVSGSDWNEELTRAVRNLSRGFQIWTELVSSKIDLRVVLGGNFAKGTYPISSDVDCCVEICKLSIRVLLSPFGSRLKPVVGRFICAVLDRVAQDDWPGFRGKLTNSLVDLASSRGLLVNLVDSLLPITTTRARAISMETSFILLRKWGTGPTNTFNDDLRIVGGKDLISFTFPDVVALLEKFPSLSRDTDVSWAYLWARLLKFVMLSDAKLLSSVEDDEFLRFKVAMKRIKRYTNRLPFVTESKKFSLAQDTTLSSVCRLVNHGVNNKEDFETAVSDGTQEGSNRKSIRKLAPNPYSQPKKKQRQMTFNGSGKLKRS